MLTRKIKLTNRLTTFLVLTDLFYISDRLKMFLVLIKVTRKTKTIEENMLSKGLVIILTRKITIAVFCSPKVSKPSTKKSAKLSTICEKAKVYATAEILITEILMMEKRISITRILIVGLITNKQSARP